MKSAYFRELRKYSLSEIGALLQLSPSEAAQLVRLLKSIGVVKQKSFNSKRSKEIDTEKIELLEVDPESSGSYFVFDFIGVLTVGDCVLKCYPKYITKNRTPLRAMQQILQVLRKYGSQEQLLYSANGDQDEHQFNLLSLILYFLNDYSENGVYTNAVPITEINGTGEIDWDRTIGDTYPVIKADKPYYTEVYTHNSIDDEMDYFKRLHECLITECYLKLRELELSDLFGIEETILYDGDLSDFGEQDYVAYRIKNELNVQFVTRKQILLRTMYAYVSQGEANEQENRISLFGTNSFNLVWEKVCAEVFNNQLGTKLKNLPLPQPLAAAYTARKNDTLLELIEKPQWTSYKDGNPDKTHPAKDTLRPDLISFYSKQDGVCFGIFDAKYYFMRLDEMKVDAQPGIGDVTKQYLYQLAYNNFIAEHGFKYIQNAFLMPTEEKEAVLLGEVEMSMLRMMATPPLNNILAVRLPAKQMFSWYLMGARIDIQSVFSFL